jgi:hypothetical protein
MNLLLLLAGILVALWVLRKLVLVAVIQVAGKAIGAKALSRQPDRIHLTPVDDRAWNDTDAAEAISCSLLARGFEDAGVHKIPEMTGVLVQLMANPEKSMYAAVYEHPVAGSWCDLWARYSDGTSMTFTTARPTGLDPRPGHPVVNAHGSSPKELYERACRELPDRARKPTSTWSAVRDFEESYAESMAWRKEHGVSVKEVAQVAKHRPA